MDDVISTAIRGYRMHVVAHRLRKFGFESSINKLTTKDLQMLAQFVYTHQRKAIEREIAARTACLS